MIDLLIPSPPISGLTLGSLRFRFYPLLVVLGVAVTWLISQRRWLQRGGEPAKLEFIVMWTAPIALVGARIYYVLTNWDTYFGEGGDPWGSFAIWEGGASFLGAVAAGALALYFVGHQASVRFSSGADVIAPAVAIGLGIGRLGNWFTYDLLGAPSDLPWALVVPPTKRPAGYAAAESFTPLFLYESLGALLLGGLLVLLDRRLRLGRGKVFALFLALYGVLRVAIESNRVDVAPVFSGLTIDGLVALITVLVAVATLIWLVATRPGRERSVWLVDGSGRYKNLEAQVRANLEAFNRFRPSYLYGEEGEAEAERLAAAANEPEPEKVPARKGKKSAPVADSESVVGEEADDPELPTTVARRPRRVPPPAPRERVADGRRESSGTARIVTVFGRAFRESGSPRYEMRTYRPDPSLRQRAARRRLAD